MFCTNCGKQNDDSVKFCIYCGTKMVAKSESENLSNAYSGGQSAAGNAGYQYESKKALNEGNDKEVKKCGPLRALAIFLVAAVLAGVTFCVTYAFLNKANFSLGDKNDDSSNEVSASAEGSSDASTAESSAKLTPDEILSAACKKIASSKGNEMTFSFKNTINVKEEQNSLDYDFVTEGEFTIDDDLSIEDLTEVNVLEKAKGDVSYIFSDGSKKTFEDIYVYRQDLGGNLSSYIVYEDTGYLASENMTTDQVIGFSDYEVYEPEMLDETENVDGIECYVFEAKDTYDQGGISGIFVPLTGLYMDDSEKCDVTIYIGKESGDIVKVVTSYSTDIDMSAIDDVLDTSLNGLSFETSMKELTYEITFDDIDTDSIDEKEIYDEINAIEDSGYSSPFSTLVMMANDVVTNTGGFSAESQTSDGTYVSDTIGNLTYNVSNKFLADDIGTTYDNEDGTNIYEKIYIPQDVDTELLTVDYIELDMEDFDDDDIKYAVEQVLEGIAEDDGSSDASDYTITESDTKIAGGYTYECTATFTINGYAYLNEIHAFNAGDEGVAVIMYISDPSSDRQYEAEVQAIIDSMKLTD